MQHGEAKDWWRQWSSVWGQLAWCGWVGDLGRCLLLFLCAIPQEAQQLRGHLLTALRVRWAVVGVGLGWRLGLGLGLGLARRARLGLGFN